MSSERRGELRVESAPVDPCHLFFPSMIPCVHEFDLPSHISWYAFQYWLNFASPWT